MPSVCILASQYFGWGIYGGFGSMARKLAESLAHSGCAVSVIVPRRRGQRPLERINGVDIHSFAPLDVAAACRLIRRAPADIFHSQDPTLLTFFAQRLQPCRIHVVTCRDPRDWRDWRIEFRHATAHRRLLTPFHYLTESSLPVRWAVRRAHGVFCPAHFLKPKVQRLYRLPRLPGFLPNLIDVPAVVPEKIGPPTFAFVGRWDKRKRPSAFLDLAAQFPACRFIAVGQGSATAEQRYDARLRQRYRGVPNLELPGFINRFHEPERLAGVLARTWALVSTSAREGLPLTFLEAAAYGCAIVSAVDPDEFATRFGKRVDDEDFPAALRALLSNSPLDKGKAAHTYVKETYDTARGLAAHLDAYRWYAS